MPIHRVYRLWLERLTQLHPDFHARCLSNFAWLLAGLYLSQSVHLSSIARKLPGKTQLGSWVQRLRRLLMNPRLRVRDWYCPVATLLLERAAQSGRLRLLVDGTKVGFHHQLLIVSLAYRRRALPIAWTWVRGGRGHSSARKQLALLRQLDAWGWLYSLRQKGDRLVQIEPGTWQRFDSLVSQPGQSVWKPEASFTQAHGYPTRLLAHWTPGEKEPWLLTTNFSTPELTRRAYQRRMGIEEMFGDLKKHGVDLEATHLRHFQRLSRLTLAVALLYVWMVALGSSIIKTGQRAWVDRKHRRDLSIFRIGFYSLERRLANQAKLLLRLVPYF